MFSEDNKELTYYCQDVATSYILKMVSIVQEKVKFCDNFLPYIANIKPIHFLLEVMCRDIFKSSKLFYVYSEFNCSTTLPNCVIQCPSSITSYSSSKLPPSSPANDFWRPNVNRKGGKRRIRT